MSRPSRQAAERRKDAGTLPLRARRLHGQSLAPQHPSSKAFRWWPVRPQWCNSVANWFPAPPIRTAGLGRGWTASA